MSDEREVRCGTLFRLRRRAAAGLTAMAAVAMLGAGGFPEPEPCLQQISVGRCVEFAPTNDPKRSPQCQTSGCYASGHVDYGACRKNGFAYEGCDGTDSNVSCESDSCDALQPCVRIRCYPTAAACAASPLGGTLVDTIEAGPPCKTV